VDKVLIKTKCSKCSNLIDMAVGQSIVTKYELGWWGAYKCPYCNNQVEMDGWGIPNDEIRNAIIELSGKWGLYVNEDNKRKTLAIRHLRHILNINLSEAASLLKSMPGTILSGTEVEMKRLQLLLENEGLKAKVEKLEK
jgi:hypothetical protein